MKVVFDTNVLISAFIVPGKQGDKAFYLAREKKFDLFTSVAILTETASKLRDKFSQSPEDIIRALKLISRHAHVVRPGTQLDVLKDAPDNRILECALEAGADLIVTGDRHLLNLKKFSDVTIIRLADFLRLFPLA